ncbi:type II toxin-antitoxin system RelE/ParE family toxin [Mitsuaria sp. GD03876]|uniref:type II toxin-antitoxin system RelE/ParE family toxin n=1 Tax=Mitsuaria sp. GD03876 TaxID=2975399 RepID=UPI002447EC2C|nr:type II toxin-antitoxin system RelE/ParE family toxin [Mitsuaria sp. GD03876]MDH0864054.1 type II toxin-antitoxin system RelE/ParE family toxin [Mitsuaria sp. GD03876]
MIVRLLPEAKRDLRTIGLYIARDNPGRAESFVAELGIKADGLSTMASSFPFARLPQHPDVRRRLHGRYAIYYSIDIEAACVDVHRIVHSSQDIERLFNE